VSSPTRVFLLFCLLLLRAFRERLSVSNPASRRILPTLLFGVTVSAGRSRRCFPSATLGQEGLNQLARSRAVSGARICRPERPPPTSGRGLEKKPRQAHLGSCTATIRVRASRANVATMHMTTHRTTTGNLCWPLAGGLAPARPGRGRIEHGRLQSRALLRISQRTPERSSGLGRDRFSSPDVDVAAFCNAATSAAIGCRRPNPWILPAYAAANGPKTPRTDRDVLAPCNVRIPAPPARLAATWPEERTRRQGSCFWSGRRRNRVGGVRISTIFAMRVGLPGDGDRGRATALRSSPAPGQSGPEPRKQKKNRYRGRCSELLWMSTAFRLAITLGPATPHRAQPLKPGGRDWDSDPRNNVVLNLGRGETQPLAHRDADLGVRGNSAGAEAWAIDQRTQRRKRVLPVGQPPPPSRREFRAFHVA